MSDPTRRDLCLALTAIASLGLNVEAQSTPDPKLIHSQLFPYDTLPVTHSANGGETRAVLHGTLATGEFIEVHETTLPAGKMPHPPHRHTHSELLLIRNGKLEVLSDNQRGTIEAGGVIFTASGVLHSLKNIGDTPANYFVVAIGIQKMLPNQA
jgi:quercetin dioxygenase-like cupin family protein